MASRPCSNKGPQSQWPNATQSGHLAVSIQKGLLGLEVKVAAGQRPYWRRRGVFPGLSQLPEGSTSRVFQASSLAPLASSDSASSTLR